MARMGYKYVRLASVAPGSRHAGCVTTDED